VKQLWLGFAVMLFVMPCSGATKSPVETQSGLVSGVAGIDPTISVFKGVPYAEPPVGNLRWTAPRPRRSWH
jgi:carboxylesterase type B